MPDERLPWFKFNTVAWRGDTSLRDCSLAAQGLWINMLALMHESTVYGHLLISGEPPSDRKLAALIGCEDVKAVSRALAELEAKRVARRTESGVLYSKRMVCDRQKQEVAVERGRKGGRQKSEVGLEVKPEPKTRVELVAESHLKPISDSLPLSSAGVCFQIQRATPLIDQRSHRKHAFCGTVCVPEFKHDQFVRQSGIASHEAANADVRRWYAEVSAAWLGRPIGDKPEDFWDARWSERMGTTATSTRVQHKTVSNEAALSRVMTRMGA